MRVVRLCLPVSTQFVISGLHHRGNIPGTRKRNRPRACRSAVATQASEPARPSQSQPQPAITASLTSPAVSSSVDFGAAVLRSAEALSILLAFACQIVACSLYLQSFREQDSSDRQQQQSVGLQQLAAEAPGTLIPPGALLAGQGALLALTLAWVCGLISRWLFQRR